MKCHATMEELKKYLINVIEYINLSFRFNPFKVHFLLKSNKNTGTPKM